MKHRSSGTRSRPGIESLNFDLVGRRVTSPQSAGFCHHLEAVASLWPPPPNRGTSSATIITARSSSRLGEVVDVANGVDLPDRLGRQAYADSWTKTIFGAAST